ncbi:VOC family protein [Glycomyces halotolerans]
MTLTAPDPRGLAAFYSHLLDRPVTVEEKAGPGEPGNAGWAQIRAPEGSGEPTLNFEYEREWRPPVWPAEAGSQNATQHLDIEVEDMETALEHAIKGGAALACVQPQESVRVLFDPAGHPFCLFTAAPADQ